MYSIYVNDRVVRLVTTFEKAPASEMLFKLKGNESPGYLQALITAFEKNSLVENITLQSADLDQTWKNLLSNYQVLEAAGGVVVNEKREILMIYRNEKWDLPKGKIEAGEEPDVAAIREVYEECGVGMLSLIKQLPSTLHTYTYQDRKIIKKTYWFQMTTTDLSNPIPQIEEGITEVRWMSRRELNAVLNQTYSSIKTLLREQFLLADPGMLG